jgi:hypothetical protein
LTVSWRADSLSFRQTLVLFAEQRRLSRLRFWAALSFETLLAALAPATPPIYPGRHLSIAVVESGFVTVDRATDG